MATLNYLYRSTKPKAFLNIRLLFRYEDQDFQIGGKTKIEVSKDYWKNTHERKRINDPDLSNYQLEVKSKLNELSNYILESFYKVDANDVNKDWLKTEIELYYNPKKEEKQVPSSLIDFFDFYAEIKKNELSDTRQRRLKVVKRKVKRFEKHTRQTVTIPKINDIFKNDFLDFGKKENYSISTLNSDFSVIKTLCNYAKQWNIKTSPQLNNLKVKSETIKSPYLSPSELQKIKELNYSKNDRLDNARDWLIISCYTGQRVSDFMRFTNDMITETPEGFFLDFKQKKTKKLMSIPFIKEAQEVITKRNGNFPRFISGQKYNEYIKEVCEDAGLKQKIKGKKITFIGIDRKRAKKTDYRKETGYFQKWELVSSHIGRRSFATNYYGTVPTNYLVKITGHSTERMFLNYIHKSEADTAKDAFKYFE